MTVCILLLRILGQYARLMAAVIKGIILVLTVSVINASIMAVSVGDLKVESLAMNIGVCAAIVPMRDSRIVLTVGSTLALWVAVITRSLLTRPTVMSTRIRETAKHSRIPNRVREPVPEVLGTPNHIGIRMITI